MKADRKNYKGIEYILFEELPHTQREQLLQSLGQDVFIKIMVDGKIVTQCIQYKDYCKWFDNHYKSKPVQAKESRINKEESMELSGNLALTKF
jgi:hypothetical protein